MTTTKEKIPLSNDSIKSAEPGQVLWDKTVKGLHMRVREKSKAFFYYYRTKAGRERRPKIGEYDAMKLAQAREIARKWSGKVAAGEDPAGDWIAARQGLTVADVVKLYLEKPSKTIDEKRRILEKDVLSRFGSRKAVEVTPDDVVDLHKALTKRGPYIANRTLAYLSAAYNLAERRKKIPAGTNPCTAVDRNAERKRKRFADPSELVNIGAALAKRAQARPAAVAFIYLLIFSGARPQEIQDARWTMLEDLGDRGVLRLPDSKTNEPRDVYLPPQAMEVIRRLPRTSGTITGISRITARMLWNEVRQEAGCPDLWMRDSRRTFGTIGIDVGATREQLGELFGHKSTQTTAIYTLLHDDPKHRVTAAVANQIEQHMSGSKSKKN